MAILTDTEKTLAHYIGLLDDLANNRTTPAKIIGTGYKQPRSEAFRYLAGRLNQYGLQLLEELIEERKANQ